MTALAIPLDDEARAIVVTALRGSAQQYQRAATKAAGELADEKASGAITDERPGAVKIARWLADAAKLDNAATAIEHAGPAVTAAEVEAQVAATVDALRSRMAVPRATWAPVETISALILATFPSVGELAAQGIAWAVHGGAFDAQAEPSRPAPPAAPASPPPAPVAPASVPAAVEEPAPGGGPAPAPPADDFDETAAPPGKVSPAEALRTSHEVLRSLAMTFDGTEPDEFPEDFDDLATAEDDPGPVPVATIPELAPE